MSTNIRTISADPTEPPQQGGSGPRSVGRVLSILEALVCMGSGLTLTELAKQTDSPKTSLHGLLSALVAERCVVRNAAGRYQLAPRFIDLAARAVSGTTLVTLARPMMVDLVEATGETSVLGALAPDADLAVYLDKLESDNPIRYAVEVGTRRELYCTAVGKVLLAHFDEARRQDYLRSGPRQRFTPYTKCDEAELLSELAAIRRDGIAHTRDERVIGASGIAAPVFDNSGIAIAALLVAGPSERVRANIASIERLVRSTADACTRLLGGKIGSSRGASDKLDTNSQGDQP